MDCLKRIAACAICAMLAFSAACGAGNEPVETAPPPSASADALQELIDQLESPQSTVRQDALRQLGSMPDTKAVDAIIHAQFNPYEDVRNGALPLLISIAESGANEIVRRYAHDKIIEMALDERYGDSRIPFIRALSGMEDKSANEALKHILTDSQESIRTVAAYALAQHEDWDGMEVLIEGLYRDLPYLDDAASIRLDTVQMLGNIGGTRSWDVLAALLQQNRRAVTFLYAVDDAMLKTGDGRTAAALQQAVLYPFHATSVRIHMLDALDRIDGKLALQAMCDVLKIDYSDEFTMEVIKQCASRADPALLDALVSAAKDSNYDVAAAAITALAGNGSPPAVKRLADMVRADKNYTMLFESAKTIKNRESVETLIALLKDHNDHVRLFAVMALGSIGDKRAEKALKALRKDKEGSVREAAEEALKKVKSGQ